MKEHTVNTGRVTTILAKILATTNFI